MWSSFLALFLAILSQHCKAEIQSIKVEYEYNKNLVKDVICELKIIDIGLANFTLGGTFLNDANSIKLTFQIYVKRLQKYIPHLITFTFDVCNFKKNNDNFILEFLPNMRHYFSSVIKPCPYSGRLVLENYQVDGVVVSKFLRPGTYRFDTRAFNKKNETFIAFKYYAILNRKPKVVPRL